MWSQFFRSGERNLTEYKFFFAFLFILRVFFFSFCISCINICYFFKIIFIGFAQITITVSFSYLEPGPRALCRCHPHSRWSTGKSDVSLFSLSVRNHFLYLFSSSTLSLMSSLGRSVSKTEVVYYTRHALVFHSCLALTSAGDWRAVNLSPTLANNQVSVKLREK